MTSSVFHIAGDNQNSALELLHQHSKLSKQIIKQAALKGAIWITRNTNQTPAKKPERIRRLKRILLENQTIDFYYNPEILNYENPEPQLIEDNQLYSIWLKPRGMLSQGSKWSDHSALYRWVEMHGFSGQTPRQSWIVHRLDRATCGLMLLAHSKKMAAQLTAMFAHNQVHKTYKAWVWGKLKTPQQTINSVIDDKTAITHIETISVTKNPMCSLLNIAIETGRKHQIRKHLASIGHPIIGDRLYGDAQRDQQLTIQADLQLTAYQLSFQCPTEHIPKTRVLEEAQLNLLEPQQLKLHDS